MANISPRLEPQIAFVLTPKPTLVCPLEPKLKEMCPSCSLCTVAQKTLLLLGVGDGVGVKPSKVNLFIICDDKSSVSQPDK